MDENQPQAYPPVPPAQASVPARQARDGAQYVRQQKGHSWFLWWLVLGPITLWIPAIYWSFSPNHYWHL